MDELDLTKTTIKPITETKPKPVLKNWERGEGKRGEKNGMPDRPEEKARGEGGREERERRERIEQAIRAQRWKNA